MAFSPTGPTGLWGLVWNDEFDDSPGSSGSTHGLLTSKWNIGWYTGPSVPGEPGVQNTVTDNTVHAQMGNYHGPAAVSVPGDGALHLIGGPTSPDNGGTYVDGGYTWTYETGAVTTAGLMAVNPAKTALGTSLAAAVNAGTVSVINGTCVVEIRMRLPGPNSLSGSKYWWPDVNFFNGGQFSASGGGVNYWPGGNEGEYSPQEEVDAWEWFNEAGMVGAGGIYDLHQVSSSPLNGTSSVASALASTDLSLAYHTYTIEFTATTISIWTDGTLVFTDSSSAVAAQWAYPQYLLILLQSHTTNPPSTTSGNDMMIDYVRVFVPTQVQPWASPPIITQLGGA